MITALLTLLISISRNIIAIAHAVSAISQLCKISTPGQLKCALHKISVIGIIGIFYMTENILRTGFCLVTICFKFLAKGTFYKLNN